MEAASGSTEVSDRSRSASALLAKITADRSPSDPKVNEFFRQELWSKSPGSFDTVLDKAAMLAPEAHSAPPKASGVNAPEPVTPKRAPRPAPEMTPSPQRRQKAIEKPGKTAKTVAKTAVKPVAKTAKGVVKKSVVKSPLKASNTGTLKKLHSKALLEFPLDMFKASEGSRPRRCRVPPLESWRNERLVYERLAGSLTPSVAAVTLDMSVEKTTARTLEIPALQPALDSFDAVELVGITSQYLISKVYALPLSRLKEAPCTVTLQGTGVIHVLDGTLRFGVEGAKASKAEVVRAGGTMLVKGPGRKLVAPAYAASRGEHGSAGVRFRWVQCTRS